MIKVKALDRRFNYYGYYSHVIEIPNRRLRKQVVEMLTNNYGPGVSWEPRSGTPTGYSWVTNPNFKYDIDRKLIYVKNPADVSAILLTFPQEN